MSGSLFETDVITPWHNYDEDLTEQNWDLSTFESLPEVHEEVEPSPEELVKEVAFPRPFQDTRRMLVRMSALSGHQSGYKEVPGGFTPSKKAFVPEDKARLLRDGGALPRKDFVDEVVDQKRQVRSKEIEDQNLRFIAAGFSWPDDRWDGPKILRKPVPCDVQKMAEMLGANAEHLHLPSHVSSLPKPELARLVERVKLEHAEAEFAAQTKAGFANAAENLVDITPIWNKRAHELAPRNIGAMRHDGTITIHHAPGAPVQPHLHGIRRYFKDQSGAQAAADWKKQAEQHQVPGKITKCKITGQSLIQRDIRGGLETWKIGPNIQGMGLQGARWMVEIAALRTMPQELLQEIYGAEFVKVDVGGSKAPDEFIAQLENDTDAWAILASHTGHPKFGKLARLMLAWRNSIYLGMNDVDYREAERIGAQVAWDLKRAYPEQFADACKENIEREKTTVEFVGKAA